MKEMKDVNILKQIRELNANFTERELVFGRCRNKISTMTPAILTGVPCGSIQSSRKLSDST
jgi:hypothetical protein